MGKPWKGLPLVCLDVKLEGGLTSDAASASHEDMPIVVFNSDGKVVRVSLKSLKLLHNWGVLEQL